MTRGLLLALLLSGSVAHAQQQDATPRTPQDSMILRARRFIDSGNTVDGRKLLDSVLKVLSPENRSFAEALYWRAATAPAAVDAERDYRRLLVEAPLSARAEDSMLQLAQLEQARGDRRAASDHLQRFLISFPNNPARPRVAVSLVRLLFDQGLVARGCGALRMGREAIPPTSVELRNQLEFYAPRCVVLEAAPAAPAAPAPPAAAPATPAPRASADTATERDSTSRAPAPAPGAPPHSPSRPVTAPASTARSGTSFYSVQVAAYDSPQSAARLVRTLEERGLEARVDGQAKPYRVRVGKYATRADAVKAAATLKAQGIEGFVSLVSP